MQNSNQNSFIFFEFKEAFLQQHDLPKQPCPVRMSVIEEALANDSLTVTKLADECILYVRQQACKDTSINKLLERLCHAAGIIVGRAGEDQTAKKYLKIAHDCDPLNYPIAADYALSLSNTGKITTAVAVFEKFISLSLTDWKYLIPHAWTEAIKLHYGEKNYRRALELVEILLSKDIENPYKFSREQLIPIANDIRAKLQHNPREDKTLR